MAKKSNKTEHVLRLITMNDEAEQNDDFFVIDQELSAIDQELPEKGVPAIKNALRIALEDDPEEVELKPEIPKAQTAEKTEDIKKTEKDPPSAAAQKEAPAAAPARQQTPAAVAASQKDAPGAAVAQGTPASAAEQEAPAAARQETPALKTLRERGNRYNTVPEENIGLVNIAEVLVKEKVTLVMERMKVCTCRTCVNDVLALALNSLPTKYVTTNAGKQYFQRDTYKKQYETDILAALTKACVRVKASPRH